MAITTKLYSKVWEGLTVKLAGTVEKEVLTQKPVLVHFLVQLRVDYQNTMKSSS